MAITIPFGISATTILALGSVLAILGALYLLALPRPFPGIPHNGTQWKILGDLPSIIKFVKTDREYLRWLWLQSYQLNSPVVQLFMVPFKKPMIVLNDYRETEDIITRRMHQFDTSPITIEVFASAIPNSTIAMPSHTLFKAQRRLWAGTMSTDFINRVAAPRLFNAGQELIDLWKLKTRHANGAAFKASDDLRFCALDAIWAAAMGSEMGVVTAQIEHIKASPLPHADLPGAVAFQEGQQPVLASAIETVLQDMADADASPMSDLYRMYQSFLPSHRAAIAVKDKTMRKLLAEGRKRYSGPDALSQQPSCAMEQVLQREATTTEKAGSKEASSDNNMVDELFLWLVAGHETTAVSLGWGLKRLAENLPVQTRLRTELVAALGKPTAENANDVHDLELPYLDAVIYEILRLARTVNGLARQTTEDTQILGYHIPKGTQVFMATSGFNALNDQPMPVISESDRTATAQALKRVDHWPTSSIHIFDPTRWLKIEDGKESFDQHAGPWMPFGGGTRGCFGKRLAMVELRIFLVQLVTNFEFLSVPEELNSYQAIDRITRVPLQCYIRPRAVI